MVGGYVHGRTCVSLGPYANEMLADLNVGRAVLSIAGLNDNGYYNSNLLLVETERVMMKAADEVVIVADSTKFGRTSLARLCELNKADILVVDNEITNEWREKLRKAGVKLVVAEPELRT